jgi:ribonuclease P protein component
VTLIHQKDLFPSLHFGVSVPKKKFPLAVDRNRMKRLLREAVRLYLKEHPLLRSHAVGMFVIFNGNALISFQEVKEEVYRLLNRFFYSEE